MEIEFGRNSERYQFLNGGHRRSIICGSSRQASAFAIR
jgi:hypothetical protein